MTHHTLSRGTAAALLAAILASLAGCSASGGRTNIDDDLSKTCPASAGLTTEIAIDGSGSDRSNEIRTVNLAVIADETRKTALCGGHLRVFGFASSTGQTVAFYDGDLNASAPTANAHFRKADKLAQQVEAQIESRYDAALNELRGTGSDIFGMLALLQQAAEQSPADTLNGVVLSDGLQNIGFDPTSAASEASASAMADAADVPNLSGASLTIVGIGRQAEGELPSTTIQNVTAFWKRVCQRTKAATCSVSTDWR
ncbi:MAG: hypothetical protein J0I18_11355 [Actinobacteria bacterium]|nr:hypothetical protein [Actinomycetota bacterium]